MRLLIHKFVRLFDLHANLIAHKDLTPALMEDRLPHAILCDKRLFLLMERSSAAYHEVLPHLINEPIKVN